jgi:hypothetical protein
MKNKNRLTDRLKDKCVIQLKSISNDGYGAGSGPATWSTYIEPWCGISEIVKTKLSESTGRTISAASRKFELRKYPETEVINKKDYRVYFDGKYFEILEIENGFESIILHCDGQTNG